MLDDVVPLLDAHAPLALRLYCLSSQATVKEHLGQFEESVRQFQDLVRLTDQSAPWRRSSVRSSLAYTYFRAGQFDQARRINEEAKRIAEADKDWLSLSEAMSVEGILLTGIGADGGELKALTLSIEYARMAGAIRDEALGMANLSDYYLHQGDFQRALALAQQALPLARTANYSLAEELAQTNIGLALIAMHRKAEGLAIVREAMERMRRADEFVRLAELSQELGRYLEQAGYHAEALETYRQQRDLAREAWRQDQQKAILELQESFDAERRRHDRNLLTEDNQLKEESLRQSHLRFRQWALASAVGLMSLLLLVLGYVRVRTTQQALRHSNERLKVQSEQDALTGLANRRHFQVLTGQSEFGAEAHGALYLLDLDHFKRINDSFGHAAGDAVLVEVARRLRAVVREEDLVVRWGGEEFLILVPGASDEQVDLMAQRLLAALASLPVMAGSAHIAVTASIGFSAFPLQPQQLEVGWPMAIDLVDSAMYLAKTQGRNRACGVRRIPAHNRVELERLMLDLEAAWRDGVIKLAEFQGPHSVGEKP
jgi:diguanylate cyclase (GGDEF)-like protein